VEPDDKDGGSSSFSGNQKMFRSIGIPSLIACVIALPLMWSKAKENSTNPVAQSQPQNPFIQTGHTGPSAMQLPSATLNRNNTQIFHPSASVSYQNAPTGNPVFQQGMNPMSSANPAAANNPFVQTATPTQPFQPTPVIAPSGQPVNFNNMTPDFGAAQTLVFPGNANGPDLTATPMEFMPVTNFQEIFRFNVTENWIKQRWKRVSTSPAEDGLHGLRVALVTGTNSWDLHGSLTYFFDSSHRVQRITYRGWAGDATRLVNLLTSSFAFQAHQTHWAGFYVAKGKQQKPTGGLLMKHPTVVYTENPIQQIALILEINNPNGPFGLSQDFHSLIEGSFQSR
jgi:hypothetical protein